MSKAEYYRKKFGKSEGDTSEVGRIHAEIEKLGSKCSNIIWHEPLTAASLKKLRSEGLRVEPGDNCYIISW